MKVELKAYRKGDGKEISNKIAPTLTEGGNSGGNHSDMAVLKVKSATSKGYEVATEGDSIYLAQPNSETRRGRVGKGKAQTLDTAANQAVVQAGRVTGRNPDNPKSRESGLPTKQMLEINENPNKTNCISTVQKDNVVVEPNYRIRRLTPIECERLQGFPDNHTEYGNYDGCLLYTSDAADE